jgi:hypothetical protein
MYWSPVYSDKMNNFDQADLIFHSIFHKKWQIKWQKFVWTYIGHWRKVEFW